MLEMQCKSHYISVNHRENVKDGLGQENPVQEREFDVRAQIQ